MPQIERRIYINPWVRFDVYKSGWVIMRVEGKEIKRKRLEDVRRSKIMLAFEEELGPLATGSPIPMPYVKPPSVEAKEAVEELDAKLKKLTKRVDKLLRALGEKEI